MNSLLRLLVMVAAFVPLASLSQGYPQRPITLVVPFAPGGGTDSLARELGKLLQDKLGQPVVIDNRGGAGGAIAAAQVAQAKPDGYTLLFITSTFVTVAATDRKLPYDVVRDFTPIAMLGRGPLLLVVNKDLPITDVAQLIEAAKKKPDGFNYVSAGLFPNVPTVQESGVRNFNVETWWGIVGPPGLPPDIVGALNKAINASAAGDEMRKRFETEGADPNIGPPDDLATVLKEELEGWRRVVREGGLKID